MFTKLVVVMVMIVVCNYEYGDIQIGNESWSSQGYALHPCMCSSRKFGES